MGLSRKERKAAKQHQCCECSSAIEKSEHYIEFTLADRPSPRFNQTFRMCSPCNELRDKICYALDFNPCNPESPRAGTMREMILDNYDRSCSLYEHVQNVARLFDIEFDVLNEFMQVDIDPSDITLDVSLEDLYRMAKLIYPTRNVQHIKRPYEAVTYDGIDELDRPTRYAFSPTRDSGEWKDVLLWLVEKGFHFHPNTYWFSPDDTPYIANEVSGCYTIGYRCNLSDDEDYVLATGFDLKQCAIQAMLVYLSGAQSPAPSFHEMAD